ncbi:MAG: hypothetical protein KDH09_04555 [Chrysiogenetes bacterium]|nr:hypothetical protein [Chrysiogenetes bacterium]
MKRLLAALLLLLAAPAWAQAPVEVPAQAAQPASAPLPVTSELSSREVSIGDEFRLRIDLPDGTGASGEPRVDGIPDEVILKGAHWVTPEGQSAPTQLELILSSFDLELEEIPALDIDWMGKDGKRTRIETTAHSLVMKRLTTEDEQSLKDVKGPQSAELSMGKYILYGLGALALFALLIWGLRRYLRVRKGLPLDAAPAPPPPPAHEVALGALAALEARDLPGRGQMREQCFELSEILRAYLEGRYKFLASEQTTDELRRSMKNVAEIDANDRDEALALFEEWDLVKFAKVPLEEARARTMLSQTRTWVTRTKPALRTFGEGPSALDIAEGRAR